MSYMAGATLQALHLVVCFKGHQAMSHVMLLAGQTPWHLDGAQNEVCRRFFSPVPDLLLMRKVRQTTWDGSSQFMKYPHRSAAKTAHNGVIRGIGGNSMRDQQSGS